MKHRLEYLQDNKMAYDGKDNRLRRKEPVGMERLVKEFIKEMKISSGMNAQRAFNAWNEVSGASKYTVAVSLERAVMYVTLSSSVVRNQLFFQRDVLLEKVNEALKGDELFIRRGEGNPVRSIVLR